MPHDALNTRVMWARSEKPWSAAIWVRLAAPCSCFDAPTTMPASRSLPAVRPTACSSRSSVRFLHPSRPARLSTGMPPSRSKIQMASAAAERSAAAEAIWIFEREGGMPVESLAGRLGCKKRTLERELQAVGLTAGKLRLAGMVVGASKQLQGAASLTQIAADQGFSDLAHMTRVFKASCGMSPSALRGSPYHGRANSALG